MEYSALIVAAGSGSRMGLGYNKMLFPLKNGHVILEETLQLFLADQRCQQIVVAADRNDMDTFARFCTDARIVLVEGGARRQDSVYNGLCAVRGEHVLIHDGARPWLPPVCIDRLLGALQTHNACVLMVPVKDTIKVVADGRIIETPPRDKLWQAQTPQAFLTQSIIQAYERAMKQSLEVTDDAQIMELCGKESVYVVEGSYENIKVTTMEDVQGR